MARLGGSPLGLVGLFSVKNQGTGNADFYGGDTRTINVDKYNTGKNPDPEKEGTRTMFSGDSTLSPYPNLGKKGVKDDLGTGVYNGVDRNQLHNNNVYDTTISNIIKQLSPTEAALRPSDFAYLKNIGVFPNNRLMIARRYPTPHTDNIFGPPNFAPIGVLISWKPVEDDFVSIQFGETWEEAGADFTNVLNSLGKDFGLDGGLQMGNVGGAAANVIPLPGFTESLQRKVLENLGVLEKGQGDKPLPSGNPNLIKTARRRKTIDYSTPGSGLNCKVSIKMVCEYEQKFIAGIDPTIAFQDIISMITNFGTSRSDIYGLSGEFAKKINKWVEDPSKILQDMTTAIKDSLEGVRIKVTEEIEKLYNVTAVTTEPKKELNAKELQKEKDAATTAAKNSALGLLTKTIDKLTNELALQIQKYRIEIEGIARALTGAPSTPWHVTLGNPMRPVFSAGDMYIEGDVTLSLGSTLAFNDLPSSIKAEFTLTNARPWGLQEIVAKFNGGSLRVVKSPKDSNSTSQGETVKGQQEKQTKTTPTGVTASATSGGNPSTNKKPTENSAKQSTKTAVQDKTVVPDANSPATTSVLFNKPIGDGLTLAPLNTSSLGGGR